MMRLHGRGASDFRGTSGTLLRIVVHLVQTVSELQPRCAGVRRSGTRPLIFQIRQERAERFGERGTRHEMTAHDRHLRLRALVREIAIEELGIDAVAGHAISHGLG